MKFISTSEKQTFSFAKKFARRLNGGEILGLIGNLGAGKTVFAKGLAAGLKIKKKITSPTFVLMRVYPIKSRHNSRLKKFVHIDAYRLKTGRDLIAIGAKEYFNSKDSVIIIEWADRIKKILPKNVKIVKIKYTGGNNRIIYY